MSAAAAAAATAAISSSSSSNSLSNHYHHQLDYHNFNILPYSNTTYQLYTVRRFYYNGPAPGAPAPVKRMLSTPATVESESVLEEEKVTFTGQDQTPGQKKKKSKVLQWWKAMSGCLMVLSRRNAKRMSMRGSQRSAR